MYIDFDCTNTIKPIENAIEGGECALLFSLCIGKAQCIQEIMIDVIDWNRKPN